MPTLLLLLACAKAPVPRTPDTPDVEDSGVPADPETTTTFASLDELFAIPASDWFGVTADRSPRDPRTLYTVPAPWEDNGDDLVQPWFDVGNNSLLAEIDVGGRVEYPVVRGPLAGYAPGVDGSATFAPTDFLAGSPWSFEVDVGDGPVALDRVDGTSVDVLGGRLFRWNSSVGDLAVQFVPFAPSDGTLAAIQPRSLIATFRLENLGEAPLEGVLYPPSGVEDADDLEAIDGPAVLYGPAPYAGANHPDTENWIPRFAEVGYAIPGYEAVTLLGDDAFGPDGAGVEFTLAPGESRVVSFAMLVGGGLEELAYTRDLVRSEPAVDWLNGSWGRLDALLGDPEVPDAPYVPEMMRRYAMVSDDAFLFDGDGRLHHDHGGSWILMGMIAPTYLAGLIPGGDLGVTCPPDAATVRWSLYGTTLPPLLGAEVYRWSGETADLGDGSAFEAQYRCVVDAILDTQYPDVALFPSSYIWDGPSRGDYHTGSNLAVWALLSSGARFADELWADPATATAWSAKADALEAALLSHNVVDGYFDDQWVEGAWADGHVDDDVLCHDGEEIMVAEAPIFGFFDSDDPRRIRHGIAAMSTVNPFYEPAVDGMYWGEGAPVTAPGWITAMSGAATADARRAAIDLWRSHTDVDGSMYWWPYDYPATDPSGIRRRMSLASGVPIDTAKVDYATGNALALLLHDVFGLSGDVVAKEVTFRPDAPWSSFTWTGAPVGIARFDVSWEDTGSTVVATLTNREDTTWTATVAATVPDGTVATSPTPTGRWYTRDSYAETATLAPGERLTVTLAYTARPTDLCVDAAWDALVAASDTLSSSQQTLWADADGDDLGDGWAFRLLAEARCVAPEVDAAWQANATRCGQLGWGDDWTTLCASYATVSSDGATLADGWNGRPLGLVPYQDGVEEPLSATGDFDADGSNNLEEFAAGGGATGSMEAFAASASGG